MKDYFVKYYGNPEAKYYEQAIIAKNAVDLARQRVADFLGCDPDEVIFNSGATEGNNTVLKGVAEYYKSKGNHIITTAVEHSSVYETCKYLETKGFEVTYLEVDKNCQLNIEAFMKSIRKTTILVSIMWVNSEVGSIFPVEIIAQLCKERGILFHTDATQAVGKIPINAKILNGLSFITISSHKINGPKGVGAMIMKKDELGIHPKITPLMHGGEQEKGYRAGTQNVPAIVGFGKACLIVNYNMDIDSSKVRNMENKLITMITQKFNDRVQIVNNFPHVPGFINLRFKGINNQILLKNTCSIFSASNGSACSNTKPSRVLRAIGLDHNIINETIRITLTKNTREDEIDTLISLL